MPENSKSQAPIVMEPSPWVQKFTPLIEPRGAVLDLACGPGRHTRFLLAAGYSVTALDKDVSGLNDISGAPNLEIIESDLETGADYVLKGRRFSAIVVVNYLYRPLFAELIDGLASGGVLIYQTFMQGNEAYGRPRNPDFLLQENELKEVFGKKLTVTAFEQGYTAIPSPAMTQKICAIKG